jgi:RNA polymerase sigma factor (sigma-70 family)
MIRPEPVYEMLHEGDPWPFIAIRMHRLPESLLGCDIYGRRIEGSAGDSTPLMTLEDEEGYEEAWRKLRKRLKELISEIPERQRVATLLRYFGDKTLDEVGSVMDGISHQAAGQNLKRAERRLKKLLTADQNLVNLLIRCGFRV